MSKKRYRVHASVTGSKYLGELEAESEEDAEEQAWGMKSAYVGLCHQCSDECEDPEISRIFVEEVSGGKAPQ